ncbi:MAG: regulator, partial [Polyangia bacterium]|nr:regulator [Polyangia bacterium]
QSLLARGAILTGLLWGAIGALVMDGRYLAAALFSLGAALLTLFGFIHEAGIGLHPGSVFVGYLCWALLCLGMFISRRRSHSPG